MRALIIDDEPLLRRHLDRMLAELWAELEIVGQAADGEQAWALIESLAPDLIFLDIRMPRLDGMQLAKRLQQMKQPPVVVFTTAYDEFAVQAFEQQALDYLLKPISEARLQQTINRIRNKQPSAAALSAPSAALSQTPLTQIEQLLAQLQNKPQPETLKWLKAAKGESIHIIAIDQVFALVAEDKYVTVHSSEGEFLLRSSLKELKQQLDPDQFWLVHRSVIIQVRQIDKVSRDLLGRMSVQLKNGQQYPVSRSAQSLFKTM
ncbi:two component transcriptional regulator, LytTR family [Oceanospirillum multiglobuliferum]|uniref:DNA-binding response regulator n=1 Tax=Oceanospirillum multiglobuliferum TaxID=64969 RepID=A0A1T4N2X5_9GAMM|nr:LytTR family DNA-binding domain-containing protein [Oceanospirillum multiglobuliferum]OPX55820.1 DNA-binding response regulator [Oceanospirillum multiglobuliferum]SJZ73689.1 two component transcriptional regulator, LytTR family [Oceanospirillum multiglobuliferum]